jgi:hypothetical protein
VSDILMLIATYYLSTRWVVLAPTAGAANHFFWCCSVSSVICDNNNMVEDIHDMKTKTIIVKPSQ